MFNLVLTQDEAFGVTVTVKPLKEMLLNNIFPY